MRGCVGPDGPDAVVFIFGVEGPFDAVDGAAAVVGRTFGIAPGPFAAIAVVDGDAAVVDIAAAAADVGAGADAGVDADADADVDTAAADMIAERGKIVGCGNLSSPAFSGSHT